MAKKTKGKNSVESVAETLCNFSRFLCDIVISVYLFVILAVLPLYNRGYAQIGTDKENFFIKTMTSWYCFVHESGLDPFGKSLSGALRKHDPVDLKPGTFSSLYPVGIFRIFSE